MAVTVTMPQLGETVTEGTILSWAKKPGDTITEDEVLLEISTDKVDTEVPSPAAGVVTEILVEEGETVSVGTPLAVIASADEAAGGDAPTAPEPEAAAPAPQPASEEAAAPPPPAPAAAPEPEPVAPAVEAPAAPAPPVPVPAAAPAAPPALVPTEEAPRRAVLSPVVRKLAAEHEIDLNDVPGSGDGGRITRKDVMSYIDTAAKVAVEAPAVAAATAPPPAPVVPAVPAAVAEAAPAPAPEAAPAAAAPAAAVEAAAPGVTTTEISRLRRRIATNLVQAKRTAAHVWTSVEVDFEDVEIVRRRHKEAFKAKEGFSLTYLPFISRATVDALAAYPEVNSAFDLDAGVQTFNDRVHLGIAVDLNREGLVVVTLKNADGLRLRGIAREVATKAGRARDGKLEPDDVAGSTFSITNPGPFGSFMSAPIINVPNAAILSTDTVAKRPTVVTLPDGTDTIAIRHIGYLGLTWDHRVFDGSTAVLFLRRIKENLETWDWEQELS